MPCAGRLSCYPKLQLPPCPYLSASSSRTEQSSRLAQAAAEAVIDFSFHMTFNRTDARSLAEVQPVVEAGLTSFKIYMAYDGIRLTDAEMLLALDAIAAQGGLAIVHAENHAVIMH